MAAFFILLAAFVVDAILGETKRFHPLVGFGRGAQKLEAVFNREQHSEVQQKAIGSVLWLLLILPIPAAYYYFSQHFQSWWLDIFILYLALGNKSLREHAVQVYQPLTEGNLTQARHYCSYLVSRDTSELSEQQISRAVVESVLENGHDAVIASLFWYCVGGIPLVIAHRLANTLDAMWGYKNSRYLNFGWCSAKMDDCLGWPSAKVTALLYAIQSKRVLACLVNAYKQGRQYKSLNGGWAMASGATSLNIELGGAASYFGQSVRSVTLGQGQTVAAKHILASVKLINRAAWLLIVASFPTVFIHFGW